MNATEGAPRTFGRFELLALVEEGIGGRLYRARDPDKDRIVLLKIVSRALSENPAFGRYFYHRWADKDTMFEHPNVAGALEVGKEADTYYFALDEIDGQRLSETLRKGPFRVDEALEITRQIAEALRAAHRREIVHGDLKPSDIFLCKDKMGRTLVKVLFFDLGVAASESMVSIYGETVGTPKYMAPEVISGGCVTPQSDIFALGVVAYELLTGREPFPSDHVVGHLFSKCTGQLTPAHEVNKEVPREAGMVVSRALAKEPPRRYTSVQKLLDDLDRCEQAIKTGQVTVVPMGSDSAFARSYELPEPRGRRPALARRLSVLNWAALGLAALALLLALHGWSAGRMPSAAPVSGPQREAPLPGVQPPGEVPPAQEAERKAVRPPVAESEARRKELAAREAYEGACAEWEHWRRAGRYDLAVASFKEAAKRSRGTPYEELALEKAASVCTEWGDELLGEGKYEESVAKYDEALSLAPEGGEFHDLAKRKLPEAMTRWADFCFEHSLYDKALEVYEDIEKRFPASKEAARVANWKPKVLISQAYGTWKVQGLPGEALSIFESVIENYSDTEWATEARTAMPSVYLDIAKKKIEDAKLEEAHRELADIVEAFPRSPAAALAAERESQVLLSLYDSARNAGDAEAASGYFEELVRKYPTNPSTLSAIKAKLSLTPQPGESMFTDSIARSKLREAQEHFERFEFTRAINTLEGVARYTEEDSPVCAEALERLPHWVYLSALHTYGRGRREEAQKHLQSAAETYGFSPWGKKAARALKRIKEAPKGMVYVPEGRFYMGTDLNEITDLLRPHLPAEVATDRELLLQQAGILGFACEMPRHISSAGAYYIDETEVTNKEYAEFVRATGHRPPPHWPEGSYAEGEANKPVANVTFRDAQAYAAWAGKRLPTEAEWEKAARGVDGRLYPWGDVFDRNYCHHLRKQEEGPAPVGSYSVGASPYGCLDMIGNVNEWTSSWFDAYPGSHEQNSLYGETRKVVRGGPWEQVELVPISARCASRYPAKPEDRSRTIGFRCVRDVKEE